MVLLHLRMRQALGFYALLAGLLAVINVRHSGSDGEENGVWSEWTTCSAPCNGSQNRSRYYKNGQDRSTKLSEERRCNIEECFKPWTEWSKCSQACGTGFRNRTKYYKGDNSNHNNHICGSMTITESCNNHSCNTPSSCNMTCGIGFRVRRHNCTYPHNPDTCTTFVSQCNQTNNSTNTEYEEWSDWTECAQSCGINYQRRTRKATGNFTGLLYNPEVEARECVCLNESCNCRWSNWTECNVTCDGGVQTRVYNCSSARLGMASCIESKTETRTCNNNRCPVDGNFTEWSNWTTCSVSCGNGTQQRMRNCTNPPPAHGGRNCTGNTTETRNCKYSPCPVDGNFTEWSNWTTCSVSCGNGTQQRMRNCTNPTPAHGGKNCTGNTTETRNCKYFPCPVDGNFTEWSNWTTCSVSCGNGTQQRMRNCTNPPPAHGGRNCTGNTTETRNCKYSPCPVDGNFTEWSIWTTCSVSCGNGTQQRMRNCTNPPPAHGGRNCTGNTTETRNCKYYPCPVDGNFTEWSNWTTCSVSCGNGTQQRMRNCTNPPPAHGGRNCTGNTTDFKACEYSPCPDAPVNGSFGEWSSWTNCTLTCGSGTQQRARTCTNPPPANGGANCTGPYNQTQSCNTQHCPIHGNWTWWSEWSYCNRPCGIGYENSTRSCTNPAPMYGGRKCEGPSYKSRICNNITCPAAKVLTTVRFIKEKWTKDLEDLESDASKNLENKILTNLTKLYEGRREQPVDKIKINSFKNGSVVANFTIFYRRMNSIELIILQEGLQKTGFLHAMPVQTMYFNTTKVPSINPSIQSITNHTSTSIFISWTNVTAEYLHGKSLKGFSAFYRERSKKYLPNQMKSVKADKEDTIVYGLKKYTDYSLRLLAFTESGNGISSDPVDFRTDEDVPSVPPSSFRAAAASSTEITVHWKHIPEASIHGILEGYNVTVTNTESGETKYQTHVPTEIYAMVENLKQFTRYSVQVCGYTSKGCGVKTKKALVTTHEDVPTKPPTNLKAVNLSKTFAIELSWDAPPADGLNGIVREYQIEYKIKTRSGKDVLYTSVNKKIIPDARKYTLNNLMPYTMYEIKVAARTSAGTGPFATTYGETCRCPKTINTNYWFHNPYLNTTSDGKINGIFSHIIKDMITWACAECENGHGKTRVDFARDGNRAPADKNSMLDVIANVHQGAQVSFPINGNKHMTRVYGGHPFVPVVESPGVAFLSLSRPPVSPAWNIFKSVINMFPFIVFSLLLAYLAGVVVWYLDSDSEGSSFPRSFIMGAYEGLWWSFISMTTVGYGDRSPIKRRSRLFAMFWTLYGMVLVSIITSAVTTSLTTVTVETKKKVYGIQVAAIQNSSEHRLGLLLNGKVNQVNQYHSVEDVRLALLSREVEGALMDAYVVATDMKRFTDESIEVTKLLDRPFGYGIALSTAIASIESECRNYLQVNAKTITTLIDKNTGKLENPIKSASVEKSSGLFDPSSHLYRNSAMFVGSLLLFAVMCGIVWQFTCNTRAKSQVTPSWLVDFEHREVLRHHLKQIVEEFYISFIKHMKMMKKRHREERWRLYKRMKEREKQRSQEKTEEQQVDDKGDDLNIVFKAALKLLKQ